MPRVLESKGLFERMAVETLPSGMKCFIIPKKGFIEKQALIAVNYGSADLQFECNGENIKTPQGVAHFLEHKMFEHERINYFDAFTELGASVNAFTNFNVTAYYCNGYDNFDKCLALLFDMVQTPYFTRGNVEKEKGIIDQEINMYRDNPFWRAFFNMQQGLYKNIPVKYEIAGTTETIKSIDADLLNHCYDVFYTPSNMALVCIGDFFPNEILEIAAGKSKASKKETAKKILEEEPRAAVKNYTEDKMNVSRPLFSLGYKDSSSDNKEKLLITTKILLDIIAGESSALYQDLYNKGLLDGGFSLDYNNGTGYGTSMFTGAASNPEAVSEAITNEVERVKRDGIDKAVFQRILSKHMGRYIRSFNSISQVAGMQADFFTKGFHVFDLMDGFESMSQDMVYERLKEHFKKDNKCLSVVKP